MIHSINNSWASLCLIFVLSQVGGICSVEPRRVTIYDMMDFAEYGIEVKLLWGAYNNDVVFIKIADYLYFI